MGNNKVQRPWHLAVFVAVPVALVLAWWITREAPNVSGAIYAYDIGSDKLFTTNDSVPPFAAPSGADAGVLAHAVIFDGETTPAVVCLISYTPEAHAEAKRVGGNSAIISAGVRVRRPTDTDWIAGYTDAGRALREPSIEMAAGRAWRTAIP